MNCTLWTPLQFIYCTVVELHGPSCYSMYIVQLLNCRVPAVTVYTLYSYWTAGSKLWQFIHCTVVELHGPSCDSMYIVQLLNCRVPAVTVCQGAETSCVCVCNKKNLCKEHRTEGVYCRCVQYIKISVFVKYRRVHLFIVNCLLKNKFNIHLIYYLHI